MQNLLNIGLVSYNLRQHLPSNIPSHNQFVDNRNLKSQMYFKSIVSVLMKGAWIKSSVYQDMDMYTALTDFDKFQDL